MKNNHKEAKEIIKHVDSDTIMFVKEKISAFIKNNDNYIDSNTVANYARGIGERFASRKLKGDELKEEIIIIVEPMYDVFTELNGLDESAEHLFNVGLQQLLCGLRNDQFNSVVGSIEDLYYDYE